MKKMIAVVVCCLAPSLSSAADVYEATERLIMTEMKRDEIQMAAAMAMMTRDQGGDLIEEAILVWGYSIPEEDSMYLDILDAEYYVDMLLGDQDWNLGNADLAAATAHYNNNEFDECIADCFEANADYCNAEAHVIDAQVHADDYYFLCQMILMDAVTWFMQNTP